MWIDSVDEHFRVRTFEYSADKGLTLKRQAYSAQRRMRPSRQRSARANSYDAAEARKVSLMKQAGFNAVRFFGGGAPNVTSFEHESQTSARYVPISV